MLNLQHLKTLNNLIKAAGANPAAGSYPLKDMFKTVKIGSRLCYGIAYSDNGAADPKVDDFAKKCLPTIRQNTTMDRKEIVAIYKNRSMNRLKWYFLCRKQAFVLTELI